MHWEKRSPIKCSTRAARDMSYQINRIYNNSLDRDWFSARGHLGVQLQMSNLNFL